MHWHPAPSAPATGTQFAPATGTHCGRRDSCQDLHQQLAPSGRGWRGQVVVVMIVVVLVVVMVVVVVVVVVLVVSSVVTLLDVYTSVVK